MISESDILVAFDQFRAARMVETNPPDDDERFVQIKLWVKVLNSEKVDTQKFAKACDKAVISDSFFPSIGRICSILDEGKTVGRSPGDCKQLVIEEDVVPPEKLREAMKKIKDDIKRRKLIDPAG